jgi:hypothetical protein
MSFSAISALSPLDGRYASRLAKLRPIMSELGYMQRRLQVELAWLVALSDAGFREFAPLTPDARRYLSGLVLNFSEADGEAIKAIEKTTNHDVKAVEYWIKAKFEGHAELVAASEFVHFACTSEDINNTSHALQLQQWTPSLANCARWRMPFPMCPCSAVPMARLPAQPRSAKRLPMWSRGWMARAAELPVCVCWQR